MGSGAIAARVNARQRILVLFDGDVASAPRVLMEIEALVPFYDLIVAGRSYSGYRPDEGLTFVQLPTASAESPMLSTRIVRRISRTARSLRDRFERRWMHDTHLLRVSRREESDSWFRVLRGVDADLVIAHHAENLPLALRLAERQRIPVVFNAHEYYPRQFEGNPWWDENVKPLAEFLCRRFLPLADAVLAVSPGIAEEYRSRFGVDARLVMNTKPFHALVPTPVDPDRIRLIHHGIANPNRHIENMIELIDLLDERFRIDFMIVPSRNHPDYFRELCARIEVHPRLALVPPVPTAEIIARINQYDLGLFLLVPGNFNLLHFLPNKFFEFIQARLGVAFTPIPDVSALVTEYGLGVLSEGFTPASMANALNALSTGEIREFKNAAHDAARDLSSERSYGIIRDTVRDVLETRRAKMAIESELRGRGSR